MATILLFDSRRQVKGKTTKNKTFSSQLSPTVALFKKKEASNMTHTSQALPSTSEPNRQLHLPFHSTCNNLFYYGLAYNMSNLSGNEFLNFFLLGVVELPSNLLGWWGAQNLGRRWTAAGSCMLSALGALVTVFLTGGYRRWVKQTYCLTKIETDQGIKEKKKKKTPPRTATQKRVQKRCQFRLEGFFK